MATHKADAQWTNPCSIRLVMDDIEAVCRDLKQDALMVVAVTPYFGRH